MNLDTSPGEKKKQPPRRRRWRYLFAGAIVILLVTTGILFNQWQQRSFYLRAIAIKKSLNTFIAPNSRRYVTVEYAASGYAQAVWLVDTAAERAYQTEDVNNFYDGGGWSADSRYAILNGITHYGSSNLVIFDLEQGREIPTPGYDPCGMFPMSVCNDEVVIAVAPVSPLIITASGIEIHLPEGTHRNLFSDRHLTLVDAAWSPSEDRIFWLGIKIDSKDKNQAVVIGYFTGQDGENPVQAVSMDFDRGAQWSHKAMMYWEAAPFCGWFVKYIVECGIEGQLYSFKDPESE